MITILGDKHMKTKPWMVLVAMMAGWLNRQQQEAIACHFKEAIKSAITKTLVSDLR
jgi:hypothetical protein